MKVILTEIFETQKVPINEQGRRRRKEKKRKREREKRKKPNKQTIKLMYHPK
jgi:hypothetical protein